MISIKFGEEDGGWNTIDIRRGYGIGLWKDIRKEWLALSQNTTFSLGNGRRLGFLNSWCGEIALCNAFSTLFNLIAQKDTRVADVWDFSREEKGWSPIFL